jgi:hypothetical protein
MSDPSAVDRLREQLDAGLRSGNACGHFLGTDRAIAITALLPLVTAFGDAREAAGREQGRQDAAEAILEAAVTTDTPMIGRAWLGEAARLARGSGVSVQPTLGKQP